MIKYNNEVFDGATYEHKRDSHRLTGQMQRIYDCMSNGMWYTLKEVSEITGAPEASASAGIRNLRKERFGGFTVDREHISNGLYKYRLNRDES